ncbi:enoyl-CoA hydratase [Kaustia mangrovi]|uniref:Enoyl-CoA hydratase domain-containing protein 3, mitochondrial n=1 Tax=Kaustia mangrovi TaxID=2593653 RepID=A0A7S8C800_9HYPH|nr:enoyl-CoA hydratase [Kaustia mangrovi]QPC44981.1 enoyl-CoA hydratase [Kaustia mangrovi]
MTATTAQAETRAADEPVLLQEHEGGILRLTLNRPAARNGLSEALISALHDAVAEAGASPAVRVVVIAANGPAFSAGHDLKEVTAHRGDADRGRAYFAWLMERCSAMMQAVVHCRKPVIAEVQGVASAAGCQLVASCDLAVAGAGARFCTPGVNIGLFCSTPMVALSRNVARKHAMEMLLTGEMMAADEAMRMGLVNRVVPDDGLTEATMALARTVASKSMATVATGKEAFYRQLEMPLEDAYAYASRVMVENMLIRDAEEGIGAFLEKRPPNWEDR